MAGSWEHDNDTSGFICEEFIGSPMTYQFTKDFSPWSRVSCKYSDCAEQIVSDTFYEQISVFILQLLQTITIIIIIIIIYK